MNIRQSSFLLAAALAGCYRPAEMILPSAPAPIVAQSVSRVDIAPKEEPRLVPAEAYMRTYLQLFGGLSPLEAQRRARGGDGGQLFDAWADYLSSLGFPDYRLDLPRASDTNALMVATFERLGDALCDRAVEYDLRGLAPPAPPPPLSPIGTLAPPPPVNMSDVPYGPIPDPALSPPPPVKKPPPKPKPVPPPLDKRIVFAFEIPATPLDPAAFAARFDVLHRTFLGYPAALGPAARTEGFFHLYEQTFARHAAKDAPKSRFTPAEAAWATVCQGLIRHPEFHFY